MKKNNKTENPLNKIIANAKNLAEHFRGVKVDVVKVRENKSKIFRAMITVNNIKYSLGYHENVIDAAKAYNKKAKSLFGSERKAKAEGRWNMIA